MAFDKFSKIETFPPFPEMDMLEYEKDFEEGKYDYRGITRS